MTWIPEKKVTTVDRFQVRKGTFDSELEAENNAEADERPKFRRFVVSIDSFKCSDCGRVHIAEMSEEEKNDAGEIIKPAAPIEPEPCEHEHSPQTAEEQAKHLGPKNPWEA